MVCDSETEQEVKKAMRDLSGVRLLSIGRVEDCKEGFGKNESVDSDF